MKLARIRKQAAGKSLVLGLSGFTSISAVEGVQLSSSSKRMFAEFDGQGLSAEQRRMAIVEKHTRKHASVQRWLHDEVAPTYDRVMADPAGTTMSAADLRVGLMSHMDATVKKAAKK